MKFQHRFAKVFIAALFFLLAAAACSAAGAGGEVEPDLDSQVDLAGTSWTLVEFGPEGGETAVHPNTTITLNFEQNGINGSAGCNSYFAEATFSGNELSVGPIGATKMACPEPIMQQEFDFLAAMASVTSYTTSDQQLRLSYSGGVLVFAAGPAAEEAGDSDEEDVKTLFVGPELVDCVGLVPQQCLQIKENEADEWTLFYGQIEGFVYEPGFIYELRVRETQIENPPADGASIMLSLVEIVGQSTLPATPVPLPDATGLNGTSWTLVSFGPDGYETAVLPDADLTMSFAEGQINGFAGCNSYFADVTIGDDGTISVGLVGSTLMACMDEAMMQQESDFLAALAEVTRYTRSGSRLTLHSEDGSLVFVAAAMHESGVEGAEVVDWETAVSILNTGEVTQIFQTHSLDVTLTLADGRVIQTVEPAIDDIFTAVQDCGEPCRDIMMATE